MFGWVWLVCLIVIVGWSWVELREGSSEKDAEVWCSSAVAGGRAWASAYRNDRNDIESSLLDICTLHVPDDTRTAGEAQVDGDGQIQGCKQEGKGKTHGYH